MAAETREQQAIRHADELFRVDVPRDLNAEWVERLIPAAEMKRLGVSEDTVEVEENRVVLQLPVSQTRI